MSNFTPFAADLPQDIPWMAVLVVFVALFAFSTLLLIVNRYKRCRSDQVLVIFGKVGGGNTSKCIHGGAAFVWPLIQDHAYLSLEPIQIEIPLRGRYRPRTSASTCRASSLSPSAPIRRL